MDAKINACLQQLVQEADHYLFFFAKRCDAEDAYADLLNKMAQKVEDGLTSTHRGIAPSTLRATWVEMVRDTLQTAETHRMAASMCRQRVIEPLTLIKETFERTRRRCKDDLKACCNEYAEYKQTVQHFQRSYVRHCADLAALQHAETSAISSSSSLGTSPSSDVAEQTGPFVTSTRPVSPPPSPKPVEIVSGVTASLQREIQQGYPTAPSNAVARASEAFKKSSQQLTSIVNKLGGDASHQKHEQGGSGHSSSSNGSTSTPSISTQHHNSQTALMKFHKAKREAEQADNDYRRSIYHLETLRLQKERVHRASRQSCLEFVVELGHGVKKAIESYCDVMQSTCAVCSSMFAHTVDVAQEVQAELDAIEYSAKLPLEGSIDGPIWYENAYVGRCKSLVFGMPLDTYSASFTPPRAVPRIVELCIESVEQKLLEGPAEGLYRISPSAKVVQKLVLDIEKDENAFYFTPSLDVHAIAAILKLYLRRLPQPLCPMPLSERLSLSPLLFAGSAIEQTTALSQLAKRVKRSSLAHQTTLAVVTQHLTRVADFEAGTKMSINSLCLIFTPCIFETEDAIINDRDAAKDRVLEAMIRHPQIFDKELSENRSRSDTGALHVRPSMDEEFPMRMTSPLGVHSASQASQRRSFSVKRKPVSGSSDTGELHSRPETPVRSASDDPYMLYQTYNADEKMNSRSQTPLQAIPPVSNLYTNPPARSLPPGAGSALLQGMPNQGIPNDIV